MMLPPDSRDGKATPEGPRPPEPTVPLGIAGWRVPIHSHIACLWETEQEFDRAVGFLVEGLRGTDHCVLVGDDQETQQVISLLERRGIDVQGFQDGKRLTIIRPAHSAQEMFDTISEAFEAGLAAGAPTIRLLGNVGWNRKSWPPDAELFLFEARLNEIAQRFPCVLLCLQEVRALTGLVAWHGATGTHPQMLAKGGVLANPFLLPLDRIERLGEVVVELSKQQGDREALRRETEILQAIFDNSPFMISFYDASGHLLFVNREWERVLGWSLEEARRTDILLEAYPDSEGRREVLDFMQRAEGRWKDFRTRTRNGKMIDTSWIRCALSDGTRIGFGLDVTERRLAEERQRRSHEELRALSERLRAVREEESTRIARAVHDEVGQALTALQMDVAWLGKKLGPSGAPRSENLAAKLRSMAESIDQTIDAVQRIATELRPAVLDGLGLEAAIEWYVREFEKRTGIACRFHSDFGAAPIDSERATAVFRILQEALTNVARHSGSTRVEIRLIADMDRLRLEIEDDGRGIPEERLEVVGSLGLLGMRERARSLGGDLSIGRASPSGTVITLTIPRDGTPTNPGVAL
jgi:PAS domain S-box-containing protein